MPRCGCDQRPGSRAGSFGRQPAPQEPGNVLSPKVDAVTEEAVALQRMDSNSGVDPQLVLAFVTGGHVVAKQVRYIVLVVFVVVVDLASVWTPVNRFQ